MAITATGTSTGVGIYSGGPGAAKPLRVSDLGSGARRIQIHNVTEGNILMEFDLTDAERALLYTSLAP